MPSTILIHPAVWPHGPKIGGLPPFGEGEQGTHLTQSRLGRGVPACQISSWSVQPFGHSVRTSQTDRTDRTDRQTGQTTDR